MSIETNLQEFFLAANEFVNGVFNLSDFVKPPNMKKYLECIHLTISSILKHYMDDNYQGSFIRNHVQFKLQKDFFS